MTGPSTGATTRRLADSQHGVITGEQAIGAGLSRYMIRRKVRLKEWEPLGKDTYLVHGAPSSMACLWAAVLALPAVVSHESAAELHGLGGPPFKGAVATVPTRRTYRFAGVQVHQSTDLAREYVTEIGGLPVTTIPRTMFDLASVTETGQFGDIVQKMLVKGKVTIRALNGVLDELGRRGRPGTARFREVIAAVSPGRATPESVMEERMIALLTGSDLPMPTLQMPLPWRGAVGGRADFAYEEARVIIECDGRRWHATMEAFENDRRRDNLAQLNGWRILRFTWNDLNDTPTRVLDQITQALRPAA